MPSNSVVCGCIGFGFSLSNWPLLDSFRLEFQAERHHSVDRLAVSLFLFSIYQIQSARLTRSALSEMRIDAKWNAPELCACPAEDFRPARRQVCLLERCEKGCHTGRRMQKNAEECRRMPKNADMWNTSNYRIKPKWRRMHVQGIGLYEKQSQCETKRNRKWNFPLRS